MKDKLWVLIPFLSSLLADKARLPTLKAPNTLFKGNGMTESYKGFGKIGLHAVLIQK